MRKIITGILVLMCTSLWAQIDTVFVSQEKLADTLYHNLVMKAPTGYIANKLQFLPTDSLILKTKTYQGESSNLAVTADLMMQWLYEMNCIASNKTALPHMDSIFNTAYSYVGEMDFEEEMMVIPIGIFELDYNLIDEQRGLDNHILGKQESIWIDLAPNDSSIISKQTSSLAGPLFDYFSSDGMGLVIKSEFFISNTREISDVKSLKFGRNGRWKDVSFDEVSYFKPNNDSIQNFKIRVEYNDSTVRDYNFILNTPEAVEDGITPKNGFTPEDWEYDEDDDEYTGECKSRYQRNPGCKNCGVLEDDRGNKIKWCHIPPCSKDEGASATKPYILVTGYRPPIFGQGFKKTWISYNDRHNNMLTDLSGQEYDIFLVKFNMSAKPFAHGMHEASILLERFINMLNTDFKKAEYYENIIQGCSMGEDIARLTLLRMEKKHFEVNAPHHHTRLNIAYDANFYGANIPLGYQYQVYSANHFRGSVPNVAPFFLSSLLFASLNQKTFKELVAYHAASYDSQIFRNPIHNIGYTEPKHHPLRQQFLDELSSLVDNTNVFCMPKATRNVAISLGKISGKNSDGVETFNNAGEYWQNTSMLGYHFKIGTAKYTPSGQTFKIFRRQLPPLFLSPFQAVCKHEVNVSLMQEIDNVAGSNMTRFGNFISVSDWTYFPITQIWNGKNFYTHKPVVSALSINRNLWPADGSMTLNVKDLGLMFIDRNFTTTNQDESNHYGYPNLGRPSDHFDITPFEALYIDNKINPHIDLREDLLEDLIALNNFIFSEAEPWYLGLQNQVVGSNARANFLYYVRRRARNVINVGKLVTPSTDPGNYVVNPNAQVDLRAGDEINLKNGTHFTAGSTIHLKIEFLECTTTRLEQTSSSSKGYNGYEETFNRIDANSEISLEKVEVTPNIILYPNPSNDGTFSLQSDSKITSVIIYNIYGMLIQESDNLEMVEFHSTKILTTGTYLIKATMEEKSKTFKLVVL